jgi:signal transduction histidine kinase
VARARVRLKDVVERALAECGAQAPRPVFAPPPESLWVRADAGQLATVLGHLIRNAQDAATPQGHVAVRLELGEGQAMIEIEDDGMGMDEDFIRNRLFKPFFTTKASKGMGIGAYQAREYVRALGGTLAVQSTPGRGSVFTVGLPLAERADDTATVPAGAAS